MADINREAQEFAEIMAQVNFEMKAYGQLSASTAARRTESEMKARFGLDDFTKATSLGADALIKLGGAAKAAGSAALEGSKKASSMNAAFDELTDSVKIAAVGLSLLIPGSKLMKGVYAGLSLLATSALDVANKYRAAAVKFSDELYKGYSDQAQAGAAASDGMTGLFEDAKKLGYSLGELGEYTALIGANSKDLALFSGTVFEGRQKFADMGKSFEKYSGNLIAAGFTQVQINEGMMGYLKLQSRAGLSQGKTSEQLAEGARKYLLEMDGLSKITGQTRKEMEGQRERQLLNEQFAAKIRELQLKGTPEALAFAENLKQAGNIAARAGPQMEEAFLASVTGNFANEKAIGANIASGNALMANIQKMGQGLMTPVEAMQGTFQALGRFGDSMNGLAQVNQFEAAFGIKYSTVQEARLLGEGNLVKNLEKAEDERKKQGAEGGKAADDAVNAQVNFQTAMRKSNEQIERFFVPGMAAATNAAAALTTSAEGVAARMNKLFGITPTDIKKDEAAKASEKAAEEAHKAARAAEKAAQDLLKNNRSTKEERQAAAQKAFDTRKAEQQAVNPGPVILNKNPAAPSGSPLPAAAPTAPAKGAPVSLSPAVPASAAPVSLSPAAPVAATGSGTSAVPAAKPASTSTASPVSGSTARPMAAPISSTGQMLTAVNSELEKYTKIAGLSALAENITKFESGKAGYNAYNRGTIGNKMIGSDKPIDFSKMTIAEYLKHGKLKSGDPDKIFAVGKYQIIPGTMEGLVKKLKLDPEKTYLDQVTQDLLFNEGIIKQSRQNVAAYLKGQSNNRDLAILDMAKEFASVGVPYPAGKAKARGESYYAGIGGNKAHNPPDLVGAALDADRKSLVSAAEGGLFSGPNSGYPATLHGDEAVVPLNNGSGNFVKLFEQMAMMMGQQASSLDELVRVAKDSKDISQKILATSY